jgi:hypothetical protein
MFIIKQSAITVLPRRGPRDFFQNSLGNKLIKNKFYIVENIEDLTNKNQEEFSPQKNSKNNI